MPTTLTFRDSEVIVFTYSDTIARGYSRRQIESHLASGKWRRLRKGIYATVPKIRWFREDEHLVQVAGTLLNAGPGWHASSWSALIAHRLPVIDHSLDRVHLTRHSKETTWRKSPSAVRLERPWTSEHGAPLTAWPLGPSACIPTVGVGDALSEFARDASFVSAVTAADAALRRNLVTATELHTVASAPNLRGAARARAVAAFADGRSESPGESRLRVVAMEMGLSFTPQFSVYDAGGPEIFRADLYVCAPDSGAKPGPGPHGLLLEYDGRDKFTSRPASTTANKASTWTEFDRQVARDRGLTARGYRVMHVTSRDFADPALLKAQIWERLRSPV